MTNKDIQANPMLKLNFMDIEGLVMLEWELENNKSVPMDTVIMLRNTIDTLKELIEYNNKDCDTSGELF